MEGIFVHADNIISSNGFTTDENFNQLKNNVSGIAQTTDEKITQVPMYTSLVNTETLERNFSELKTTETYTRLEKMLILSIQKALNNCKIDISSQFTAVIISSTKGNIDLLEKAEKKVPEELFLWKMAERVKDFFSNPNPAITISNACISGASAIITASHLIRAKKYRHVVVAGGDIINEFTPSGFQSFKAVSEKPCRPFDKDRDGITLGEAAGTIILSSEEANYDNTHKILFKGGSNSNDANHISGPSRTGDGLFYAIQAAMKEAKLSKNDIHYISGHGTATVYNDEMETKAIDWAGLSHVPLNSLKGYWGHTLGAAGIIESIAGFRSMAQNTLIKTLGFENSGVSKDVNVINKNKQQEINAFLKTASGFGGCNAALVFQKQ